MTDPLQYFNAFFRNMAEMAFIYTENNVVLIIQNNAFDSGWLQFRP